MQEPAQPWGIPCIYGVCGWVVRNTLTYIVKHQVELSGCKWYSQVCRHAQTAKMSQEEVKQGSLLGAGRR